MVFAKTSGSTSKEALPWYKGSKQSRIEVSADGTGLVSRAGVALLRELTVSTELGTGWSTALLDTYKGLPVHLPGRVLADLAVMIADGGDALAHLASVRDQDKLFGPVASDAFDLPFRDYGTFESQWKRNGRTNSYQARRDMLYGLFNPLHDQLTEQETRAVSSTLAQPISPPPGWPAGPRVDAELAEVTRRRS